MVKADEIMEMQRMVAEAHEREMSNLNKYETQRIVTEQVQAHLDEAQERIQNRDRLINLKEDDIADMKAHVEQALERERSLQSALEEQRQVSNLLRDQLNREKQQIDESRLMVEQRDQNIIGLRTMAEKERVQAKRLENELRNERGLVAQLRDSM